MRIAVEILFPTWVLLRSLERFANKRSEIRVQLYHPSDHSEEGDHAGQQHEDLDVAHGREDEYSYIFIFTAPAPRRSILIGDTRLSAIPEQLSQSRGGKFNKSLLCFREFVRHLGRRATEIFARRAALIAVGPHPHTIAPVAG